MGKYTLTNEQFALVRRGLENLYYIAKDEGDSDTMRSINELEEHLINQKQAVEDEEMEMREIIGDCFYDVVGKEASNGEIEYIANIIPEDIKMSAKQLGWDDTEVRENIYAFVKNKIEKGDK